MIYLVLTMIVALEKEGGLFLNFSKNDIDRFIKNYKLLDNNPGCNERGMIILWQNKYITNEQFARFMDITYEDNKFWMVFDSFYHMLPSEYEFEVSILDGEPDWEPSFYSEYSIHDIKNYYWDDYTEKTLKEIIKFCIKKGFEIDDELMTEENTIFKDGDIYFKDKLLTEQFDEFDDIKEFVSPLAIAVGEAQDTADQDECYNKIKSSFEDGVGKFKYKSVPGKNKEGENISLQKVYLDLSDIDFNEISDWLKNEYDEYNFEDETYGSLYHILNEQEVFEFKKPYYDYLSGSIDKDVLNEYTQSRLEWD